MIAPTEQGERTRARAGQRIGAALCSICFALLGLAALLKFADLASFLDSLKTWVLIPAAIRGPLAVAVPTVEIIAAGLWFTAIARRVAVAAGIALLCAFTTAYLAHLLLVGRPTCNCIGILAAHDSMVGSAMGLVTRNAVLIGLLLVGAVLRFGPRLSESVPVRSANRGARAGFTLLELLISLAIVAILISLLLPSLAHVRASTQNLKSMANLRTHAVSISAYTTDYADVFPYLTDPKATATVLRGGGETVVVPFFMLFTTWNVALADDYYDGSARHGSFRVPWQNEVWPYTFYFYGDTFISRPEYWNYATRRADGSQLGPTNAAEVLFPSQKGLVFELGWRSNQTPSRDRDTANVRFSLVDGSAGEYGLGELNPAYVYGSQQVGQVPRTGNGGALPCMGTIDGVRGRDVR